VSIILHWLVAVVIVALFALGLWMTGLSYAHPWYNRAPSIHESVGLLLLGAVVFRLLWRIMTVTPRFEPNMPRWERGAALGAHWLMYLLMLGVLISGYLIPTADGSAVGVFGWFEVPSLIQAHPRQADFAGWVHYWGAWLLIAVAVLHTAAALKHHFFNRDRTLLKILGVRPHSS
jgi:cytochrome b561